MNISEYTEGDKESLEAFKAIAWPAADKEHYGDNQPNFFLEKFTLIAKEGDNLLGYISVIADSGVAQIEPLMVLPERKGQGIGSALIKAAEEKAKSFGVHKVWLETGSDWKSRTFYEKHGYSVRVILPNHSGGREFVLLDKML